MGSNDAAKAARQAEVDKFLAKGLKRIENKALRKQIESLLRRRKPASVLSRLKDQVEEEQPTVLGAGGPEA